MKFILINPEYMTYGDPTLGLAYLAAYIRKYCSFVDVKIFDQLNDAQILKQLKKENPEIIGLSAVSQNYYKVKELAKRIKHSMPNSILILGGVHITTFPKYFKDSSFDIAVRGEGEIPTFNLLKRLNEDKEINFRKLSKVPGLLLRDGSKIIDTGLAEQIENLDEIPLPARDILNMNYYTLPRFSSNDGINPTGGMLTSRGCPYNCKFCSSSSFWGRRIRFFSAKRVIEEIILLYEKYKYRHIVIYDDLFTINKPRLREIIAGLKEKKLLGKIKFTATGRTNCFDEETASLLKTMGITRFAFGLESGSSRVLKYLKGDNITIQDHIRAFEISKKYGLDSGGFFMIGSPTETLEEIEETYNFIKKYCAHHFVIYQTTAYPGTIIWDYGVKHNIIPEDFYEKKQNEFVDINPDFLLSHKISKEDFIKSYKKIRALQVQTMRRDLFNRILKIKLHNLRSIFSIEFMKKAYNLRNKLFKKISFRNPSTLNSD